MYPSFSSTGTPMRSINRLFWRDNKTVNLHLQNTASSYDVYLIETEKSQGCSLCVRRNEPLHYPSRQWDAFRLLVGRKEVKASGSARCNLFNGVDMSSDDIERREGPALSFSGLLAPRWLPWRSFTKDCVGLSKQPILSIAAKARRRCTGERRREEASLLWLKWESIISVIFLRR